MIIFILLTAVVTLWLACGAASLKLQKIEIDILKSQGFTPNEEVTLASFMYGPFDLSDQITSLEMTLFYKD